MPTAPLHPCVPGCSALLPRDVRRCPDHTPPASQGWNPNAPRIRGSRLQAARKALWLKDPRCQQCQRYIALSNAIRDHVVNLGSGGTDTDDNCQILCVACHTAKTQQEAQRGRR